MIGRLGLLGMLMAELCQPSSASAACASPGPPRLSDYQTDRWVGSARLANASQVRAYLEQYNPWVDHVVYAWVQLVYSPWDVWAKVGWNRVDAGFPTPNRYTFWEGKTQAGTRLYSQGPNSSENPTLFDVIYNGSGSYSMYRGGALVNTWVLGGALPDLAQISGQTSSASDQLPGGVSNKMSFTGAQVKVGGVFQSFSGTPFNSLPAWYGLTGLSTTAFDIWDTACAS
jgi:hypothetical protein